MKCLSVLIVLLLLVQELDTAKMNPFNFRKKILNQFNGARRILASGDVSKILEVLDLIPALRELFDRNLFGPASDMYKMVWNRQLEQASWEYIQENGADLKKFGGTLHHKDYIGFHWMGDIWKLLELALDSFPVDMIKNKLKGWLEMIEKLIILLWMGLSIPHTHPIEKGAEFGAGEAIFANRFEIGCYSKLVYSVCFVKKIPYQTQMFTPGAACSKCETDCELIRNKDGMDELGELCVPPKGFYAKQQEEMKALENYCSSNATIILVIFLVFLVAFGK